MGKKVKGRKSYIVTDIIGNLIAIYVHAANKHDTKGGVVAFDQALQLYPSIKARACSH